MVGPTGLTYGFEGTGLGTRKRKQKGWNWNLKEKREARECSCLHLCFSYLLMQVLDGLESVSHLCFYYSLFPIWMSAFTFTNVSHLLMFPPP